MAKLKTAAATGTAAPQETADTNAPAADTPPAGLFQGDETGATTTAPTKSPTLVWTAPRRLALVTAYAGGAHTTSAIAEALKLDPAFTNYPADEITAAKIRTQILKLRKAAAKEGVTFPLPVLDREPGSGRPTGTAKPIDWSALNAVLTGGGSGEAGATGTTA